MSDSRNYHKKQTEEFLFCGHASWEPDYGTTIIPENTYLYMYAPLGAALDQAIPRALAAGATINAEDLVISRISPVILFNYNMNDTGENAGKYQKSVLKNYPLLLKAGDTIENFNIFNAGEDALTSSALTVINVEEKKANRLSDLLEKYKGNTCHFGGCSWVRTEFDKRNLVTFMDAEKNKLYRKPELTEEQKMQARAKRFGL